MRPELEGLAAARERAGILLDFDGTLAEIVPKPEEATPVPGVPEVLVRLAGTYRTVAVVSGRRASDVARRIQEAVPCYGLYGLEDDSGPRPEASAFARLVEEVLPRVRRAVDEVPGARLEHKGFHLAAHYRGSPDPAAGSKLRSALAPLAAEAGMRVLEGKQVLELAPEGGPTKGDVVRRVAAEEGLGAILYAGDDLGDLEAFAAVTALREQAIDPALRVAVRSAETPAEVLAAADLEVPGPRGLLRLLEGLAT